MFYGVMTAFLFLLLKAFKVYESPHDGVIALILIGLDSIFWQGVYLAWLVRRGRR